MKQIFIVEVNVPHDQYGIDTDELVDTLKRSHDPDVNFKVALVTERADIAIIEYLLRG